MESPSRSPMNATIASLPVSSPPEPLFNCFVEYLVDPLYLSKPTPSPRSLQESGGKKKKNAKTSTAKSPSRFVDSKPSPAPVDASEIEQAASLAAQAAQCAKTQPEMAYKLFARAGQAFAKNFRTQESAKSYFYVSQLQTGLLRAKIADFGLNGSDTTFSVLGCLRPKSTELSNETKQVLGGFSVLFKAHLYLARLLRPYDTSMSLKCFWNCLETFIPSQAWNDMQQIFQANFTLSRPLSPETHSLRSNLSQYCTNLVQDLKLAIQFVDEQRSQAAGGQNVLFLWRELSTITREVAGFICAKDASIIGIILLEISLQLIQAYSTTLEEEIAKIFELQSSLFAALKMPHWQADCLIDSCYYLKNDEIRHQNLSKALHICIQKNDGGRIKRILTDLPQFISLPPVEDRCLHLLLNLAAIVLSHDCGAFETLLNDAWTLELQREDVQIKSSLDFVKSLL